MKELLNHFSFGDFVAYFLPGLATVGAVAGVLHFTPFRENIAGYSTSTGLVDVLLIACAAYITGAVVSGMGARLLRPLYIATRLKPFDDPRSHIEPETFASEVKDAFDRVFPQAKMEQRWTENHFYLLRSAVHHVSTHSAVECSRQNSLMQLRENLLLPILAWGFVGLLLGIELFSRSTSLGLIVAAMSLVGSYLVAGRIAWRAVENRRREVREACLGFLVAERLGLFARRDSQRGNRDGMIGLPELASSVLPVRSDVGGGAPSA